MGDWGVRGSSREVGWEQIGERTAGWAAAAARLEGALSAGVSGELTRGDLAARAGRGEEGPLAGRGEATWETGEEGERTGVGERNAGLLAVGEGDAAVVSGFVSSGRNGSGKKRLAGLFSRDTWMEAESLSFRDMILKID